MLGSDLYISLIIGVVLSLIYAEKTGVLPAGLIVPGYLALIFDQPLFLAVVLLLSFLCYLIVTYGIGRFTILYGRRKFAAMMAVGIALKLIFDSLFKHLLKRRSRRCNGRKAICIGINHNSDYRIDPCLFKRRF